MSENSPSLRDLYRSDAPLPISKIVDPNSGNSNAAKRATFLRSAVYCQGEGQVNNSTTQPTMKELLRSTVLAAAFAALSVSLANAAAPAGYVDFGKLPNSPTGGQFVEVNVNSNIINMVAKLTQKSQPDVADLIRGLQGIRVNVIGLSDDNREEMQERVKAIRQQLDTGGWDKVVSSQDKNQDVGVYLKTRGPDAVEGVVVTVLDGRKQAVLINVVGDIAIDKLGMLGEKFNIDPLKKVGDSVKHKGHKHPAAEDEAPEKPASDKE